MKKEEQKTIPTWKPTDEEIETLERVNKRLYTLKTARDGLNLEVNWDKWEKQVSCGEAVRGSELKIKNPSKVKNNLTRSSVFSILALAVIRNSETQLIAQDESDQKVAPVLQAIIDYVNDKSGKTIKEIRNLYSTIVYGTGVRKHVYRSDMRKIKSIDSYDPETEKTTYTEKTVTEYNDLDMLNIDIRGFYPDDRATCIEDCKDCAEVKTIAFDDIEDDYPKEKYPNVIHVQRGSWFRATEEVRTLSPFGNTDTDLVEVVEYRNKPKDLKLIIMNGILLTKHDNPMPEKHKELPYTVSRFQIKDGESFWGIGLPENIEHDQALIDTLYNMLVDWMKVLINPPCLRGSGEEQTTSSYELEAGAMIDVNDVNNYMFLKIPGIDQSFFNGLQKIEMNAFKKVGLDDPQLGVSKGGTATEAAIASQAARDRLQLFFAMLEEDVDIRDAKLQLKLIQQFYSNPEKIKKIVGDDGFETFEKEYRKLPVDLKKSETEMGEQEYTEAKGKYLEVNPEALGYDEEEDKFAEFTVKIKSRGSIPISKEIMQKKWLDLLGTLADTGLLQLIPPEVMLEETFAKFDYPGDKFMPDTKVPSEEMITLAEDENERMMKGEPMPPTQGATPEHTDRHFALMQSTDFKSLEPEVQQMIVQHAEGEQLEQEKGQAQEDQQVLQGQEDQDAQVTQEQDMKMAEKDKDAENQMMVDAAKNEGATNAS